MKAHKQFVQCCSFILIVGLASACGSAPASSEEVVATATPTSVAPTAVATPAQVEPTATAEQASTLDRRAILSNIVETLILPLHRQLLNESEALHQSVEQFAAHPTLETLSAAQAQWRKSADAWARIEPFDLRPVMLAVSQIKKWPVNTKALEQYIADEEMIDESVVVALGATEKGLTAIEYFLFGDQLSSEESLAKLVAQPKRMTYLLALAQNQPHAAADLLALWSADGGNQAQAFIDADFSNNNVQGSISMLANQMIAVAERVARNKLDAPLLGDMTQPQPDAVESPYADDSIPLMVANLQTLQQIFHAGLGDYVDRFATYPNDTPLSVKLDAQLEKTIASMEAINLPLRAAILENPKPVEDARDSAIALLVLLKADMANQLGITVTFNDSDGD